MQQEKYGFVYVWHDSKHNMFYVGCHWGLEDDGYICSSTRMRNSYNRRKEDFKRRIIARVYTNRQDLLAEEHKWLSQIKDEELGKKFYNMSKRHFGHWTSTDKAEEIRKKISDNLPKKRKPLSPEHRAKLSAAHSGKVLSEDHKRKLSETGTWNNLNPGAWNTGISHTVAQKKAISSGVKKAFADGTASKKISEKLRGRKLSPEHVQRIVESRKRNKLKTLNTMSQLEI